MALFILFVGMVISIIICTVWVVALKMRVPDPMEEKRHEKIIKDIIIPIGFILWIIFSCILNLSFRIPS
jgi:hypothetical protein